MDPIIPRSLPRSEADTPRTEQASGPVHALLDRLGLSPAQQAVLQVDEQTDFAFRLPEALRRRIRAEDPADPVLRQVLPTRLEQLRAPGDSMDPVAEAALADGALIRKYAGRALLITTQACDVHCRYCFRRHFDSAAARSDRDFGPAFEQLQADDTLRELILSGGDPLTLSNARLRKIVHRAGAIDHLTTLRIHTRSAIVRPERVDAGLCALLQGTRLRVVVVTHANCAAELGPDAADAMARLQATGATLLNQAVLLRGVNDTVTAQVDLSRRLFACAVLPYYLHQLDPVAGAAHFSVPDDEARVILRQLEAALPGYLVPRLVREIPGEPSKTPLGCETN